jgi:hypothetical protein
MLKSEVDRSEVVEVLNVCRVQAAVDRLLGAVFLDSYAEAPAEIVLDLDATDDPLYGRQEGRFFHGYYGDYCYLPLYIFCAGGASS